MKRKIVLIAAAAAGVLAAIFTRLYLSAKDAEVKEIKDAIVARYGTMDVLCFKGDTPSGTAISKSDIGYKSVPAMGMRGQALEPENFAEVVGRKTLLPHRKGDVLFWSDVEGGSPASQGLSSDVKRSMRAISINCTGAASVSAMVRPNDHVDVIGTFDFGDDVGVRKLVTCTMLQNVLVLATGQATSKNLRKASSTGFSTVTLEVTPREAEMLAFAEQIKGRLVLTLRNRNDTSYERELPQVNYEKIRGEIEELNLKRQKERLSSGR